MKVLFTLLCLSMGALVLSCATPSRFPEIRSLRFPNPARITEQKPGEFVVETYSLRGFDVDVGTILVPENRSKPDSRLLPLPFLRYRSKTDVPLEPVFYLAGGPGGPNAVGNAPLADFFLDAHDVVFVGYRGFDGRTFLSTPTLSARLSEMFKKQEQVTAELVNQLAQAFRQDRETWKEKGIDHEGYTTAEVIEDVENVRLAMGYDKINLFGQSYGTRLTYYYSLRYPQNVNRAVQQGLNPPGGFTYKKDHLEKVLGLYNSLWKTDPDALKLSPDLYESWKNVLLRLPITVDGVTITQESLSLLTHGALFNTAGAALVFKMMLAAERGDFLPLTEVWKKAPLTTGFINADYLLKGVSADYNPSLDYLAEAEKKHPGSLPYFTAVWAMCQADSTFIRLIPELYRSWRDTDVETLLINGTLDPSTPPWDLGEYAAHYKKGKLILVRERSHSDIINTSPALWKDLILTYYRTGAFDESKVPYQKVKLY